MAFIRKRGKKYSVVYKVRDEDGSIHQKSESFSSHNEANNRKKEIEYKMATGKFEVQKCAKLEELLQEYIKIYGRDKWGVSTYDENISIINNYIIPTIGETDLKKINTHFLEKYYQQLLSMPAVKGSRNKDGSKTISTSTVNEIHKILRSCFRQGKKWNMMEKNPAEDATVPKHKKAKREIWTADMLMQAKLLLGTDTMGGYIIRLLRRGVLNTKRCGAGLCAVTVGADGRLYSCSVENGNSDFYVGTLEKGIEEEYTKEYLVENVDKNDKCKTCWAAYICSDECMAASYLNSGEKNSVVEKMCYFRRKLISMSIVFLENIKKTDLSTYAKLQKMVQRRNYFEGVGDTNIWSMLFC